MIDLEVVVHRHYGGTHRRWHFDALADGDGWAWPIKGIDVIIVRRSCRGMRKWWLIPNNTAEDDLMEDIGPFDRLKTALITLQLLKD